MTLDMCEWRTQGAFVGFLLLLFACCMISGGATANAADPVAYWSFDRREAATVEDAIYARVPHGGLRGARGHVGLAEV